MTAEQLKEAKEGLTTQMVIDIVQQASGRLSEVEYAQRVIVGAFLDRSIVEQVLVLAESNLLAFVERRIAQGKREIDALEAAKVECFGAPNGAPLLTPGEE